VPTGVIATSTPTWPSAASPTAPQNITHWTEVGTRRQLLALEQPALLAEDVRAFFATLT